ncbi:MAG: hypothetical protein FOGNACKC_04339 [Anaerolineae bacterium]|nr:hypothetical protein [Anaerolineae bacterium]
MANPLELFLLGDMALKLNGKPLEGVTSQKAIALFIYLTCNPGPVSRDRLAGLFYGHLPQATARADISVLLSRLKPLAAYVQTDRRNVSINLDCPIWLDVAVLEEQLAALLDERQPDRPVMPDMAANLEAALSLYRGDFLAGFHPPRAPAFEEWVILEQERLHQLVLTGLEKLAGYYLSTGQYQAGLKWAGRLVQLDPLYESGHRQMMLLLTRNNQRAEALAHYQNCRQILADQLNVPPSPETITLYERIRQIPGRHHDTLPLPATSFIGREEELAWIEQQLQKPACRLLTLVGPGGIGKTRLAIEAARREAINFWHGVCFVPLSIVPSANQLLPALTQALRFSPTRPSVAEAQLMQFLRQRELLLVLDSVEYLFDPAGSEQNSGLNLLIKLLDTAPDVKILVTSRRRLNLSREWVYPVPGLPTPKSATQADLISAGASRLLLERGRQVRPEFSLAQADGEAIVRLCRLTHGMPLAIEIAAGWLKLLSVGDVAAEIERSLAFLQNTNLDVVARHQNILAVIESSWQALEETERYALRQFAVFKGGFRREAAQALLVGCAPDITTAVPVKLLATLVDRSFLRVTPAGRYMHHPLMQQFALERLAVRPNEHRRVIDCHGQYYTRFLKLREKDVKSFRQNEAFAEISEERENVLAAWQWAIAERQVEAISDGLESLLFWYANENQFQEGVIYSRQAVEMLQGLLQAQDDHIGRLRLQTVLSHALAFYAINLFHTGQFNQFKLLLEEGQTLAEQVSDRRLLVTLQIYWGLALVAQGDSRQAETYVRQAMNLAKEKGYLWLYGVSLGVLAQCLRGHNRHNYAEAAAYLTECAAIFHQMGDRRSELTANFLLGELYRFSDDFSKSDAILAGGLDLARREAIVVSEVWHLVGLIELNLETGSYQPAASLLLDGLDIAFRDDHCREPIPDLNQVTNLAESLSRCVQAQTYARQALDIAMNLQTPDSVLPPLIQLAGLLLPSPY